MSGWIVTVPVDGPISASRITTGQGSLDALQKVVGGFIEVVPLMRNVDLRVASHAGLDPEAVAMIDEGWRPCQALCNEDGKNDGLPMNETATRLWATALVKDGHLKLDADGRVAMGDVLVGPIAIVIGTPEILAEL